MDCEGNSHHRSSTVRDKQAMETKPDRQRLLSVTLLAVMVLIISGVNLVRFIKSLYLWEFLSSLPGISPFYLAFTGLLWTLIGLPTFWLLWRGRPGMPVVTIMVALAYSLYYWLDRTLIADPTVERTNVPFVAGFTVILLLYTAWTLTRPGSIFFFSNYNKEQPSQWHAKKNDT